MRWKKEEPTERAFRGFTQEKDLAISDLIVWDTEGLQLGEFHSDGLPNFDLGNDLPNQGSRLARERIVVDRLTHYLVDP